MKETLTLEQVNIRISDNNSACRLQNSLCEKAKVDNSYYTTYYIPSIRTYDV